MDLPITNVINISVAAAQAGLGQYNTSNIALFTRETPGIDFGLLGYKIYRAPTEIADDFGSSSNTYAMGNAIFSQQPNILANGGYVVVIPFQSAETLVNAVNRTTGLVQYFALMAVEISSQSNMLAAAAAVQALNKMALFMSKTAADVAPGGMLDLLRTGSYYKSRGLYYGSAAVVAVQSLKFSSVPASGAYVLNYNGTNTSSLAYNANAAAIQSALQAISGLSSVTVAGSYAAGFTVTFTGVDGPAVLLTVTTNTLQNSTPASVSISAATVTAGVSAATALQQCLVMAASYAGRAFSTNFGGSNTTQVMHLKDLIGVQPDPSMTQTLLEQAVAAGADTYVSIQGVPKVFTSGANRFFDQVYNQEWFVGAVQVALFNLIAQTSTKLPQTENGMDLWKGAARGVCQQGVANQYLAPGTWTSPDTFGDLEVFLENIQQRGFYVYTSPIATQAAAARAAREAPLMQIALKEAGGVQKGNVLININP